MNLSQLLDFFYPPLCLSCQERSSTRFLCPNCWLFCALPDPVDRCRHCFEELDQRHDLCKRCRDEPALAATRAYVFDPASPAHYLGLDAPEAMAGFAYIQWLQLEWPAPTALIPMPDRDSISIGRALADLMEIPFIRALAFDGIYKEGRLEEDEMLLLFDVSNFIDQIQKAAHSLADASPKKIYQLSLFPYVDHIP